MARYRKVEVKTWADRKFRELTAIPPCGQGLWLWFLTGTRTTNIPGVVIGTAEVMAAELRWSVEAFREAFREAFDKGMAKGDLEAGLIWLPNASRPGEDRNKPESPNVIRSWRSTWEEIPECALKFEVWQQLKAFAEAFGEGFGKAFQEACRQPSLKAYPQSGAGTGAGTGAVHTEEPPVSSRYRTNSGGSSPHVRTLTPDEIGQLKAAHPEGTYHQKAWLTAERNASYHLGEGRTFEAMLAMHRRYAAQCRAKGILRTKYVLSPETMYDRTHPMFDEPFPLPEEPERTGRPRTFEDYMANLNAHSASHDEQENPE